MSNQAETPTYLKKTTSTLRREAETLKKRENLEKENNITPLRFKSPTQTRGGTTSPKPESEENSVPIPPKPPIAFSGSYRPSPKPGSNFSRKASTSPAPRVVNTTHTVKSTSAKRQSRPLSTSKRVASISPQPEFKKMKKGKTDVPVEIFVPKTNADTENESSSRECSPQRRGALLGNFGNFNLHLPISESHDHGEIQRPFTSESLNSKLADETLSVDREAIRNTLPSPPQPRPQSLELDAVSDESPQVAEAPVSATEDMVGATQNAEGEKDAVTKDSNRHTPAPNAAPKDSSTSGNDFPLPRFSVRTPSVILESFASVTPKRNLDETKDEFVTPLPVARLVPAISDSEEGKEKRNSPAPTPSMVIDSMSASAEKRCCHRPTPNASLKRSRSPCPVLGGVPEERISHANRPCACHRSTPSRSPDCSQREASSQKRKPLSRAESTEDSNLVTALGRQTKAPSEVKQTDASHEETPVSAIVDTRACTPPVKSVSPVKTNRDQRMSLSPIPTDENISQSVLASVEKRKGGRPPRDSNVEEAPQMRSQLSEKRTSLSPVPTRIGNLKSVSHASNERKGLQTTPSPIPSQQQLDSSLLASAEKRQYRKASSEQISPIIPPPSELNVANTEDENCIEPEVEKDRVGVISKSFEKEKSYYSKSVNDHDQEESIKEDDQFSPPPCHQHNELPPRVSGEGEARSNAVERAERASAAAVPKDSPSINTHENYSYKDSDRSNAVERTMNGEVSAENIEEIRSTAIERSENPYPYINGSPSVHSQKNAVNQKESTDASRSKAVPRSSNTEQSSHYSPSITIPENSLDKNIDDTRSKAVERSVRSVEDGSPAGSPSVSAQDEGVKPQTDSDRSKAVERSGKEEPLMDVRSASPAVTQTEIQESEDIITSSQCNNERERPVSRAKSDFDNSPSMEDSQGSKAFFDCVSASASVTPAMAQLPAQFHELERLRDVYKKNRISQEVDEKVEQSVEKADRRSLTNVPRESTYIATGNTEFSGEKLMRPHESEEQETFVAEATTASSLNALSPIEKANNSLPSQNYSSLSFPLNSGSHTSTVTTPSPLPLPVTLSSQISPKVLSQLEKQYSSPSPVVQNTAAYIPRQKSKLSQCLEEDAMLNEARKPHQDERLSTRVLVSETPSSAEKRSRRRSEIEELLEMSRSNGVEEILRQSQELACSDSTPGRPSFASDVSMGSSIAERVSMRQRDSASPISGYTKYLEEMNVKLFENKKKQKTKSNKGKRTRTPSVTKAAKKKFAEEKPIPPVKVKETEKPPSQKPQISTTEKKKSKLKKKNKMTKGKLITTQVSDELESILFKQAPKQVTPKLPSIKKAAKKKQNSAKRASASKNKKKKLCKFRQKKL